MGINQLVSLDFPLALITSKKESLIFTHKLHEPRTRSPLISWSKCSLAAARESTPYNLGWSRDKEAGFCRNCIHAHRPKLD